MPMFKRQAAVLLALTALALGVVFYLWPDGDGPLSAGRDVTVNGRQTASADKRTLPEQPSKENVGQSAGAAGRTAAQITAGGRLIVFVSGAVKQPGVFELQPGSRIEDAVKAAGGFGPLADTQKLNLAQPLTDGQGVEVPRRAEGQAASATGATSVSGAGSMVRLNSATEAELETLPGIGPALAGRIVEHRNRHGAFQRIEDIQEVPGIGAGRFEKMKGRLTL